MKPFLLLLTFFSFSCASRHLHTTFLKMPFDKQGHRGCRGLMPENTIPAMLKAIDLGVTTLEMDAVITADSQVLLSHEPFFNHEITTKSDGSFVTVAEEKRLNIYKMTYAETKTFDVGMKSNARFPKQQKLPVTKPLLNDVIDQAEAYVQSKNRPPVFYNIETKTTPQTDNVYHPEPDAFVRLLMQVIKQKGLEERVIIQSFDFRTLQIVHKSYPQIKTSLLITAGDMKTFDEQLRIAGFTPTIYSPHFTLVNKELVSACHSASIKLLPWTVNTAKGIADLKNLGVDGIITDYPDLFADHN